MLIIIFIISVLKFRLKSNLNSEKIISESLKKFFNLNHEILLNLIGCFGLNIIDQFSSNITYIEFDKIYDSQLIKSVN